MTITAHTQINLDLFNVTLAAIYVDLFANHPDYEYSKNHVTPEELARKMTLGLASGHADKGGEGVKRACRKLGIQHTYKAIQAFLDEKGE